jgi:hypothetical protein
MNWLTIVRMQGVGRDGGIKVYAVLSREDGAEFARNNNLQALFHVDDPGPRVPIEKGRLLDVNQALEVVRFDIQYCDWRARQDLLAIMVLHNKVRSAGLAAPLSCGSDLLTIMVVSEFQKSTNARYSKVMHQAPWGLNCRGGRTK